MHHALRPPTRPLTARTSVLYRAVMLLAAWSTLAPAPAVTHAAPRDGTVVSGNASIRSNGVQTDIVQTTARAVIDWRQFNIGAGESVHFRQPDARSSTLNRVTGGDASVILGTLTGTGQVLLLNPNGVLFGRDARVDTAGLVVSTAQLAAGDFMAGRLVFTPAEPGPNGPGGVVNQGTITVREGGLAALVAPHVRNDGVIRADLGRVVLASGTSFTVDLAGDGLLSLAVREADLKGLRDEQGRPVTTLVENTGSLIAASGRVVVMTPTHASDLVSQAIHLGGVVRADTIQREASGAIVLSAAQGTVRITGDVAAPGGSLQLRHGPDRLEIQGDTASALGRTLRSGTRVDVETAGDLWVTSRIDGRGGAAGAALSLSGARVDLRSDLLTQDGAVGVTARAGTLLMNVPDSGRVEPDRAWPLISTGGGEIRLVSTADLRAAHLITSGAVYVESTAGNLRLTQRLGGDLNGGSPLASLTVRALGRPDSELAGNVMELRDVQVAPGGRIDIAATRNILLQDNVLTARQARPGLEAARAGTGGRTLRMVSARLGSGDLTTNATYWARGNSSREYTEAVSGPLDATGRWSDLSRVRSRATLPTLTAPGPINVLAAAPSDGAVWAPLTAAASQPVIPDVLPVAGTVVVGVPGEAPRDAGAGWTPDSADTPGGYSANRGLAQWADLGRSRGTESPKDIFSLFEHVVEVPQCSVVVLGSNPYFTRSTLGRSVPVSCR